MVVAVAAVAVVVVVESLVESGIDVMSVEIGGK